MHPFILRKVILRTEAEVRGAVRNAAVKQEGERLTSLFFSSPWMKQTSGFTGLCHIKPAGACAGLAASTDHSACH